MAVCGKSLFSKMNILSIIAVVILCLLLELAIATDVGLQNDAEAKEGVTQTVSMANTTTNVTIEGETPSNEGNKGIIIVVCVIGAVVFLAVVVGVIFYKKRRQSMNMDKEKKINIQMSSTRNAGVYQDLTVSVPTDEKPPASPEHERLKASEDA